jgi:hypothetical protein
MKGLVPIPIAFADELKKVKETGIGYHVVSVELKDGSSFEQVATSEGHVIKVRGFDEIPFAPDEVAAVRVSHKRWNFRDCSDACSKAKTATN